MANLFNNRVITLVRHGKIAGAAALYGCTDVALSETGRAELLQALKAIHQHTAISELIASPLQRCALAAEHFAQQHQIPFALEPRFQEINFGEWDGIAFDELGSEWDNLACFWQAPATFQPPRGERLQDFAARVIAAWQDLLRQPNAQHQVIVCHGGVIRIIIAHILKMDFCNPSLFQQLHIDYSSHTRIEIANHAQAVPVIKHIGMNSTTPR
jgi:alpha-ribazole phosphatase